MKALTVSQATAEDSACSVRGVRFLTLNGDQLQHSGSAASRVPGSKGASTLPQPQQGTNGHYSIRGVWQWSIHDATHHETSEEALVVPQRRRHGAQSEQRDGSRSAPPGLASITTDVDRHRDRVGEHVRRWVHAVQRQLSPATTTRNPEQQQQLCGSTDHGPNSRQSTVQPRTRSQARATLRGGGDGGSSQPHDGRGQPGNEAAHLTTTAVNGAMKRYASCYPYHFLCTELGCRAQLL